MLPASFGLKAAEGRRSPGRFAHFRAHENPPGCGLRRPSAAFSAALRPAAYCSGGRGGVCLTSRGMLACGWSSSVTSIE